MLGLGCCSFSLEVKFVVFFGWRSKTIAYLITVKIKRLIAQLSVIGNAVGTCGLTLALRS